MSYADLVKSMDPLVAQEHKLGQKTDAVIKKQCIVLFHANLSVDELQELADHYAGLYGPTFLTLPVLKRRIRLGSTYPKDEDWNPALSIEGHAAAAVIKTPAVRRAVLFGDPEPEDRGFNPEIDIPGKSWVVVPGTTAEDIKAEVQHRLHPEGPKASKLNISGGFNIGDAAGNELAGTVVFTKPGVAEFDLRSSGVVLEPVITMLDGDVRIVFTVLYDQA